MQMPTASPAPIRARDAEERGGSRAAATRCRHGRCIAAFRRSTLKP